MSRSIFTELLFFLLIPIILLEDKLVDEKTKMRYGIVPRGESIAAHFERWGLMLVGVYSGFFGLLLMGGIVTLGFSIAGFVDPFIWSRKKGMQMFRVEKKDFVLGLVVNLAPIWLFWLGFLIGGGLGAI